MDLKDMGFSTQLLRWWKSKWIGGYKNIQGMVEKHSDTEDLLQSDTGSILRGGRNGVYLETPLSRLSNHHECEDLGGFNAGGSYRERQRRNSTGDVRVGVREGILVDLLGDEMGFHSNQGDALRFHSNQDALRSHSNQDDEMGFHSNLRDACGCHDNERLCGFHGNERDVVDGVRRCLRNESGDLVDAKIKPKDLNYGLTMQENTPGALEKKKRKEFALTLYDLDGRAQLNRHDIESLVIKMLETLQSNKSSTELPPHQRETKDFTTGHRSKTIRINFSISPQSTLGKPSPEGTLETHKPPYNPTEGIDGVALREEVFDRLSPNGINSNDLSLRNPRHSISSENLIPKSPEYTRRRTRSNLMSDGETVGEHLRRKLLKIAAVQGDIGKENLSPNVNLSPRSHACANSTPVNEFAQSNTTETSTNSMNAMNTAAPTVLSPGKRRVSGEHRTFAKPSISSSKIQNLLSARKTCVLPASGKLSLLNSSSNGRFSYEKLEDGGYYQDFCGVTPQKPELSEMTVLPNDRVPTEGLPCFENVYVEPSLTGLANRTRPPCLLPWEQSDRSFENQTGFSRANPLVNHSMTPPNCSFKTPRAPLDLPSSGHQGSNSNVLGSNLPRVLRNRRSAAGAGGRKLRRRHSLCAALSPALWPQVEDREADVSADQSADEDDEDSDFGTAKHFGALGISPIRNANDSRWRRKRSSSLLQRQELLQIIRANMEKNKSCFLQPRRKPSFNHHHPSSQLPFPYNQQPTLLPTCEHPDLNHSRSQPLVHPSQVQQHRRYTTNSILSQSGLLSTPNPAQLRNSNGIGKSRTAAHVPLEQHELEQSLSFQFEQHQEKLRQKHSRPANVAELTVANVTAKELEQAKEFKEYIPIPVVSIHEPVPLVQRPMNNTNPLVLSSPQYQQKKSSLAYQQGRYKQNSKSKGHRRNHSFHFIKADYDQVEGQNETPESFRQGKLNKNRSFHCSSPPVKVPTTPSDNKLVSIRKHFVGNKNSRKPLSAPPSEKDPIYDEINLAESRRLEQDLLMSTQPMYCSRKQSEPVQCFNLKLNENNRIVFDDSMLPGSETFSPNNGKSVSSNEKRFVYKQKVHASPSTQQKILRRSKSGLIETDKSFTDDLIKETRNLSLDGKLPEGKFPQEKLSMEDRLQGKISPVPKNRHGSPKKSGRFYKHYNLDKGFSSAQDVKLKDWKNRSVEEKIPQTAGRSDVSPTVLNVTNKSENKRSPISVEKRSEVKQSRVVRNLKTFLHSAQIGTDRENSNVDGNERNVPKKMEGSSLNDQLNRKEEVEYNELDVERDSEMKHVRINTHVEKEGNRANPIGGVVNNHIYINTRDPMCCVNVLEHTLCCHSNGSHDQVCCQDNDKCKRNINCKQSGSHGNGKVKPRECTKGDLSNELNPGKEDSHLVGESATFHGGFPVGSAGFQESCPRKNPAGHVTSPPPHGRKLCAHGQPQKTAHCSLHYLKHKHRDENEKLAREQVIKWLENDFSEGSSPWENEGLSDEDCLITSGSETEDNCERGVQLHKHVHHHFYHFDSVLV